MLDLIAGHKDIVREFKVSTYEQEGKLLRFKAELALSDGSRIFIKEFVFENGERKYAYHWADSMGNVICRWDNAPHWPNVATFPHHKHTDENVLESTALTVAEVLRAVEKMIYPKFTSGEMLKNHFSRPLSL